MGTIQIPIGNTVLKRGDTINKISFSFADTDSIDITLATINMQLYLGGSKKWTISNGSGITIIDSKTFEIDQVDYTNNNLPVGTLNGDLEIIGSDGKKLTYFDIVYTITKDYTK